MTRYVALIADRTGRYAHVAVNAYNWNNAIDQLEDAGCEVVENQSDDYEDCWEEELNEVGVLTITQLLQNTDFMAYA